MFKKNAAVIDIGSSKITALLGQRGVNNTFSIKAVKSTPYSGFESSAFFDVSEVSEILTNLILALESNCNKKIKQVYVGVPGEFVVVKTQNKNKVFAKQKRVRQNDVDCLINASFDGAVVGYAHIKTSPVYFSLNDNTKTLNPIGQLAWSIDALISYFFCQSDFVNIITAIFAQMDITNVKLIPASLAQALYLVAPVVRDEKVFLVDCGYISTTFCEVFGNGIIFQKAFSRGGGHICAYLSSGLDIDFDLAEVILQKSNLGYNLKNKLEYEIFYKDELMRFDAAQVNAIIEYALDEICEYLQTCIDKSQSTVDKMLLCGGGVCGVRGGVEYISKRLNINIEVIAPPLPYFNKPIHASLISLLDAALS